MSCATCRRAASSLAAASRQAARERIDNELQRWRDVVEGRIAADRLIAAGARGPGARCAVSVRFDAGLLREQFAGYFSLNPQ